MKKLFLALLLATPAYAQPPYANTYGALITFNAADPAGACSTGRFWWNTTSNAMFVCENAVWASQSISSGSISYPLLAPNGTAAAPSYSFTSNPDTGLFLAGSDLQLATDGVSRLFIDSANNIRVGSAYQYGWTSAGAANGGGSDTGLARLSAGIVSVTNGSTGQGDLSALNLNTFTIAGDTHTQSGASGHRMKAAGQVLWSSTNNAGAAADTGLARQSAGIVMATNGGANLASLFGHTIYIGGVTSTSNANITAPTTGLMQSNAAFRHKTSIFPNTGTATPADGDSGILFTNTGDGDGSVVTLPDNPTLGTCFEMVANVDQDIDVSPSAGETLRLGASLCSSIGLDAQGDWLKVCAATNGAGAVWMAAALQGTPACTP